MPFVIGLPETALLWFERRRGRMIDTCPIRPAENTQSASFLGLTRIWYEAHRLSLDCQRLTSHPVRTFRHQDKCEQLLPVGVVVVGSGPTCYRLQDRGHDHGRTTMRSAPLIPGVLALSNGMRTSGTLPVVKLIDCT